MTKPTKELVADGPCPVNVQPPLLGQLVDNLLENACKYSKPGTPILIRLGTEPSTVLVTIEDQGSGIAASEIPNIFQPFYRSSQARHQGVGGVGLGLAITQQVMNLHNGTVQAVNRKSGGLEIRMSLPLAV
jgi:signal transduction histidine kinase